MKIPLLALVLASAMSSTSAFAQTAPAEQARTVQYHSQDIVPTGSSRSGRHRPR